MPAAPRSLPQAVLFDMDGVVADSEHQWHLLEGSLFGKILPSWREEDHEKIVGLGVLDLHRFLVAEFGLQEPRERFLSMCDEAAEEVYRKRTTLTPGFLDALEWVRSEKISLGLASSSPRNWVRMVLDRFDLEKKFRVIVTADDVGGEGKPSPAIYLRAAKLLGAEPARCAAIEDSRHGVLAAKRAGMFCVALRNGTNEKQIFSEADVEIRQLADINLGLLTHLFRGQKTLRP
ncbi:MAG: HAD-IA family hydrolase [Elusimicrobia bacterium]|nr:HAD-IA family hydrolase [Elusimicrobiota bacterium]